MRSLLAGLLIAWVASAPAAAADGGTLVALPRFVPAAGPLLAGPDQVAWVTRRDDAVLDLWVADSKRDSGVRRVQRFSGADFERLRAPRLTVATTGLGLALRVTDRRGATLRTLRYAGPFGAPLTPGAAVPAAPAPTGAVVWVQRACESAEIRVLVAAATPAPALAEPRCELRLRSPPRLHGDRLRLGVSCAGFRIACSARVIVRAHGSVVARGLARYNHTTPPYAAARLRLSTRARDLLRRGARLHVTARIDGTVTRETVVQLPAARR